MVLLVFIDGVGIGARGPHNPLDGCGSLFFDHALGESLSVPGGAIAVVDATLGVDGLPQSATGQTTIVTGQNAPAFLGRHLSAFPGGSLRPLLREHSLFARLARRGLRVAHANVAPSKVARRRWRAVSAMTVAAEEAGLEPRTLDDVRAGRALHHDFTNGSLIDYGIALPRLDPAEAGRRLARLAAQYDFCAFEYFQTDAAGHAQDATAVRLHVARLTEFLESVLRETDLSRSTVVVTSDHGNVEDLSTRMHTRNPVPVMAWGAGASRVARRVRSLADVAGAIDDEIGRGA